MLLIWSSLITSRGHTPKSQVSELHSRPHLHSQCPCEQWLWFSSILMVTDPRCLGWVSTCFALRNCKAKRPPDTGEISDSLGLQKLLGCGCWGDLETPASEVQDGHFYFFISYGSNPFAVRKSFCEINTERMCYTVSCNATQSSIKQQTLFKQSAWMNESKEIWSREPPLRPPCGSRAHGKSRYYPCFSYNLLPSERKVLVKIKESLKGSRSLHAPFPLSRNTSNLQEGETMPHFPAPPPHLCYFSLISVAVYPVVYFGT